MGVVLKARDRRLGRVVAIKRISSRVAGSAKALERFLGEARSVAALNHYNIVQVYDIDQDSDGLLHLDGVYRRGGPEEQDQPGWPDRPGASGRYHPAAVQRAELRSCAGDHPSGTSSRAIS